MKIVYCPNCGEKMIGESAGWRCLKCEGFISFTDGEFYPHIERPFVPPVTNADRLGAMSDEEKAKELTMLFYLVSQKTNAEHYILDWLQRPEGGLTWNG